MSRNPRFLRPAVLAVLALGAVVSVAANVAVAQPTLVGRLVAAWPPIALVIIVDLISRVPTSRASVSWVRRLAALIVGGIAAWMSYGHMATLAAQAGADAHMAAVFPLTVDGLIVVASLCLTELHRTTATQAAVVDLPVPSPTTPTTTGDTPTNSTGTDHARPEPATAKAPKTGASCTVKTPAADSAEVAEPLVAVTGTGSVAARIRSLAAAHPELTHAQIADAARCSVRSVSRHYPKPTPTSTVVVDADLIDTADIVDATVTPLPVRKEIAA